MARKRSTEPMLGQITFRLPPEVHRELLEIAGYIGTDLSGLLNQMIREALPSFLQRMADLVRREQEARRNLEAVTPPKNAEANRPPVRRRNIDAPPPPAFDEEQPGATAAAEPATAAGAAPSLWDHPLVLAAVQTATRHLTDQDRVEAMSRAVHLRRTAADPPTQAIVEAALRRLQQGQGIEVATQQAFNRIPR